MQEFCRSMVKPAQLQYHPVPGFALHDTVHIGPTFFGIHMKNFRRTWLSAFVSLIVMTPALSVVAADKTAVVKDSKPKLVVVLVVDGLPQEQIVRYRDQFGEGGLRRMLDQGAWYSQAHQAHGVTLTAVGHSAVLTGAYPYQHGIIANEWVDKNTLEQMYCTEDKAHTYIGEETKKGAGTSPANLRVATVGDELRYATGNQSKVVTVSGKDRGAILLAGKTGTAYMYMSKTGRFASSTYYMQQHPAWVTKYHEGNPQNRFYGQAWKPLLPDSAYKNDVPDNMVATEDKGMPITYGSSSGKEDAEYYGKLLTGPFVDEMTLDFARAAIEGEQLGSNPAGVTDMLGISLSSHDYVNHAFGPESRMSHDHLQRLDRMLAKFFSYLDKKVGLNNTIVLLTADHGFPNVPEISKTMQRDAGRVDGKALVDDVNQVLLKKFGVDKLVSKWSGPTMLLNYALIEEKNLKAADVENAASAFLLTRPGIAQVFTRTQLEQGALPDTRLGKLMQRAWHRQISGDLMLVAKPYWYFGSGKSGTSHGSPYAYDTNVPLMIMGAPWIRPGYYSQYAEVVDIAPTLAHILQLRPTAAADGRVLTEALK